MNIQSLDINKITNVLDEGKDTFSTYEKILKKNFVPGNYHNMYDYNLFNKAFSLSYNIFLLQDIQILISDVRLQILHLLEPDAVDVKKLQKDSYPLKPDITPLIAQKLQEHSSLILSHRGLENKLYTLKSKIVEQPISIFVDMVIKEGKLLDMIGSIEKFRFDRSRMLESDDISIMSSRVAPSLWAERLSGYIDAIERGFNKRYSETIYAKIQIVRQIYLSQFSPKGTLDTVDEVFTREKYLGYVRTLEIALEKKVFDYPHDNFCLAIQNIVLSTLPEGYDHGEL